MYFTFSKGLPWVAYLLPILANIFQFTSLGDFTAVGFAVTMLQMDRTLVCGVFFVTRKPKTQIPKMRDVCCTSYRARLWWRSWKDMYWRIKSWDFHIGTSENSTAHSGLCFPGKKAEGEMLILRKKCFCHDFNHNWLTFSKKRNKLNYRFVVYTTYL